ncbi:MAG: L-histidine N(alpha)-methyltransferase [Phycisphaerales bacterium]
MTSPSESEVSVLAQGPEAKALAQEVWEGLKADRPSIPAKLHYDERGSELFEEICDTPEYYITRTETGIMTEYAGEMAGEIGAEASVVEPGSGASTKTEVLLESIERCAAYVPIDISDTMLRSASERVNRRFPQIPVIAVHADFTEEMDLPAEAARGQRRLVYFPGSTIGNFPVDRQPGLLASFARLAGNDGALLIGFDLVKAVAEMEAAYNDLAGVTAEFNLNMIDRLRDELGMTIDREWFEFSATWDPDRGAIVSSLRATRDATIRSGEESVLIREGQFIETEESHKYSLDRFVGMASSAGLRTHRVWTDRQDRFAVAMLQPEAG